jgi:hypothetical protein
MRNGSEIGNPNAGDQEGLLWATLRRCPRLTCESDARDELWFVVQQVVCTRGARAVTPFGSTAQVRVVGSEHASHELIAVMDWLYGHEGEARDLDAGELFKRLRGVATKGANGSARLAQSDLLHGMTEVPADGLIRWYSLDWEESA